MENIPFYRRTTAHRKLHLVYWTRKLNYWTWRVYDVGDDLHLVDRLPVWLKRVLTGEVSPEVQPYQQMDPGRINFWLQHAAVREGFTYPGTDYRWTYTPETSFCKGVEMPTLWYDDYNELIKCGPDYHGECQVLTTREYGEMSDDDVIAWANLSAVNVCPKRCSEQADISRQRRNYDQ